MGLSKRAKRDLTMLNHIQRNNWRYHVPAPTVIDLNKPRIDESIVQAGLDALKSLKENEDAIQKLSEKENNPVADDTEARPVDDVHIQQETSKETEEGTGNRPTGGAK